MAASERRIQSNRRMNGSQHNRQLMNTYIDGNVIRHVQAVPKQRADRRSMEQEKEEHRRRCRRKGTAKEHFV